MELKPTYFSKHSRILAWLIGFLLFLPVLGTAQVSQPRTLLLSADPSGACLPGSFAENTTSGNLFYCNIAGWSEVAVGAGFTPRLDQVLDPMADKAFAVGGKSLAFNNAGHIILGLDSVDHGETNPGQVIVNEHPSAGLTPSYFRVSTTTTAGDPFVALSNFDNTNNVSSTGEFEVWDSADNNNVFRISPSDGGSHQDGPAGTARLNLPFGIGADPGAGFDLDVSASATNGGTVRIAKAVTSYNGVALQGVGMPSFLYSSDRPAQVAAISDVTMFTVGGSAAVFRFTGTINCTTTSAAATATLNLKYTDTGSAAQTVSVTDTCTTLVTSGIPNLVLAIRAKAATAITFGVTIVNTPTYDVSVRLEAM